MSERKRRKSLSFELISDKRRSTKELQTFLQGLTAIYNAFHILNNPKGKDIQDFVLNVSRYRYSDRSFELPLRDWIGPVDILNWLDDYLINDEMLFIKRIEMGSPVGVSIEADDVESIDDAERYIRKDDSEAKKKIAESRLDTDTKELLREGLKEGLFLISVFSQRDRTGLLR